MITVDYKFDVEPFKEFLIAFKAFGRDSIAVGLVGPEAQAVHPGTTLQTWEIGALQEFGSKDGHIPERSFIRSTLNNYALVRDTLGQAVRDVLAGSTAREAMNKAGEKLADAVRQTVLNVVPPPNSPVTVKWKGHAHTLIGLTDKLYDAISHRIISSVAK